MDASEWNNRQMREKDKVFLPGNNLSGLSKARVGNTHTPGLKMAKNWCGGSGSNPEETGMLFCF